MLRFRKTLLAPLLAAFLVAIAAAGCGAGASGDPDRLLIVTDRTPQSPDPTGPLSASYLRAFGAAESLFKIRPDGSVAPELALSSIQDTPTSWTVRLRPNARFWGGKRVDAKAVKASLERTRKLDKLGGPFLAGVAIAVVDPATVRFTTATARPDFLSALSHYQLAIHDTATRELTGPLKITAFGAGQLTLQPNPYYWGKPVKAKQVVVREVSDDQTRAQAAISGQAQIVVNAPFEDIQRLRSAKGLRVVAVPAANTAAIYLNPRSKTAPALADVRVRQALGWGVNRAQVITLATAGLSAPAPSWLSSNPRFPAAKSAGFTRYDPARAGALLDAAGWRKNAQGVRTRDGRPLTVRLWTWGTEQAVGEVIQAQWQRLGVTVDYKNLENAVIKQSRGRGDWDAFTEAWTTLGETSSLLASQAGADGQGNYAALPDPALRQAVGQLTGAATKTQIDRAALTVNKLMADLVPLIPLHPRIQVATISDRVSGFEQHPLQYETVVRPGMTLRPA